MKKKCKRIDITDPNTIIPWVEDCIRRHKTRYDFRNLLLAHGVSKQVYYEALQQCEYSVFDDAIKLIAEEAAQHIKERHLDLPPVHIRIMEDTTTGKIRQIGKESAMQQIYDHIAVGSCEEIFRCRMVDQQMSSIKGRGQIKGVKAIQTFVKKDNDAMRYARKHGLRYSSKCAYHVKLDIEKCYPSADIDIFMRLFEHDCGNQDIIWLWRTLLESHHVDGYTGFMIGALPSQLACQVMLSYIYRKAMELYQVRRGRKIKDVTFMIMFMDDMALFGSNRKRLFRAVKELTRYAKDYLGFTIKPNFAIKRFDLEALDMMGFVIHRNGFTEMRERNFIHSRRLIDRFIATGRLVLSQAKRLISYKGFYKYSDCVKIRNKAYRVFNKCAALISAKEAGNAHNRVHGRTRSDARFLTA